MRDPVSNSAATGSRGRRSHELFSSARIAVNETTVKESELQRSCRFRCLGERTRSSIRRNSFPRNRDRVARLIFSSDCATLRSRRDPFIFTCVPPDFPGLFGLERAQRSRNVPAHSFTREITVTKNGWNSKGERRCRRISAELTQSRRTGESTFPPISSPALFAMGSPRPSKSMQAARRGPRNHDVRVPDSPVSASCAIASKFGRSISRDRQDFARTRDSHCGTARNSTTAR